MKVSVLGNGLTGLTLAQSLVNQGVKVDIFSEKNISNINKIQTIGISEKNIDFFNENILNIKKYLWNIEKIEIYSDNLKNEKLINFERENKRLFSLVRNYDLINNLYLNLKKNNFVKFKKKISYHKLIRSKYDLIFNCDYNHFISKKLFNNRIVKDYNSFAYLTIFEHKKFLSNHIATQIFTKKGPLAFLPISPTQTSIVYSIRGKQNINLSELIENYNNRYKILKINKILKFKLISSNLRSYYHKNIIAFGDMLHKIHPLAGQGFNMTIRDIKEIHRLIELKKEHGLDLDTSICSDFENNTKSKNYIFTSGIDLIYELFNFENKIKNYNLIKSIKFIGNNKYIKNFFINYADNGLSF